MNFFSRAYCRTYQGVMRLAMHLLNFREPTLIRGHLSSRSVGPLLKEKGFLRPLIITDPSIHSLGLTKPLEDGLKEAGLDYAIFDQVVPNPTFECVYSARAEAIRANCDSLIAIGGGSSIDTAKALGALLANPKKRLEKFRGVLKVHKRFPMLIAIPTTAGTGSEATVASVVVNEATHEKFAINDPKLIPDIAVHDDWLLKGLPPKIIGATGMDALTHAVEAYIGKSLTKKTRKCALQAVKGIAAHLLEFHDTPFRPFPRQSMLYASYLAGVAFTRSYVGYVHALAHQLGGQYGVPHGYANAVILPIVLRRFGKSAEKPLSELSEAIGIHKESRAEAAKSFIEWIEKMNAAMDIPKTLDGLIHPEDVGTLAERAAKEGNPLYPVPKEFNKGELEAIYREIDPLLSKGETSDEKH